MLVSKILLNFKYFLTFLKKLKNMITLTLSLKNIHKILKLSSTFIKKKILLPIYGQKQSIDTSLNMYKRFVVILENSWIFFKCRVNRKGIFEFFFKLKTVSFKQNINGFRGKLTLRVFLNFFVLFFFFILRVFFRFFLSFETRRYHQTKIQISRVFLCI